VVRPGTVALPHLSPQLPVNRLRVVVIEGPDRGTEVTAPGDRVTVGTAEGNDLVLHDETVSRFHVELIGLDHGVDVIDHGSTNGTRIGSARVQRATVDPGTVLQLGRTRLQLAAADRAFVELHAVEELGQLRGRSAGMRRVMALVGRLAASDVAALLVGESGTGKEVIAHALHEGSPRSARPFVTVDCGALAPSLVASELFGHERGAFTGADRQHAGAFERAHGGTVFLDEIGELPAELQSSLLGVLERRRFRRVGGRDEIPVDVRIVSATNRDLRREVNAGTFRLDLYYRLAVVCLEVPPLRERAEDVAMLVEHFLRDCGYDGPVERWFPPDVMRRLEEHRWPGNVRELRNLVEATLAMGEAPAGLGGPSGREQADPGPPRPRTTIPASFDRPYKEARAAMLDEFEKRYIARVLERCGGNVSQAAREACITRTHVNELIRKHGLR
jgi:DNA-binding NtrC family response regulator